VGGSASNSVSVLGYQEMQGVSVDGYIRSADIFIDKNDNFEADAEESATVSNMTAPSVYGIQQET